ncbi:MAG TPA: MarR family transcriptional regulator [Phycisphaerae bacterium]|nr:MarR family transcriptional regulator [Phycisphaerae bacterium]
MPRSSLDESKALFIRRWGEMANYWGINRTMAEIHAMLYVSTQAVCTDDVMQTLQISRGNASMNLRSLVDWGLVERIHVRGDRKEYFVALSDAWKMFETIVRQRARREVQPILDTIQHCREMAADACVDRSKADAQPAAVYLQRLDEMNDLLQAVATVVDLLLKVGPKEMNRLSGLVKQLAE